MCVRQILEAEKKFLSLVKFSGLTTSEIKDGKSINIENGGSMLPSPENNFCKTGLTCGQPLDRRLLNRDAVPSQFPGPSYLSKKYEIRKGTKRSRSSWGRNSDNVQINHLNHEFMVKDNIASLIELKEKNIRIQHPF
ncbi:unnamed protein product [Lepeophtheirus salmonis]|uniref:(salmon louse) hypothetical protein n=1 Tax=Lepeophtheirus salmonis TaxID=72036 RepID=A0A7R8CIA8_LEPSM|nr:unnamed protein product [Lepeophtheirus salmonis]CAF2830668.1 unnamed protein product [Lepeophtheirus salmonis]